MDVMTSLVAQLRREEGQALTEYGLILALIAVVCVAALTALGLGIQGLLNGIVRSLYPSRDVPPRLAQARRGGEPHRRRDADEIDETAPRPPGRAWASAHGVRHRPARVR